MIETLAVAIVGALFGGYATVKIEELRQKQRKDGISNAIRMDTVRWMRACDRMASEWRMTAQLGRGLNWVSIASTATVHLPHGLSMLLFHLYSQREETEVAYEGMAKGMNTNKRMFEMRYALHCWSVMAEEVVREWDRYNERRLWRKICARWRWKDHLDRKGGDAEKQNLQRVYKEAVQRLNLEYDDYSVGENGELLPENHTQEAYARMQEEISAVQQRNNPGR